MSNVDMHWFLRRPNAVGMRRWSVRISWTDNNGVQQRALVDTSCARLVDACTKELGEIMRVLDEQS